MSKRFMIVEEQRRRLRAAALEAEAALQRRVDDPEEPDRLRAEDLLRDVRNTLRALGRKDTFTEEVVITRHKNYINQIEERRMA